jgi:hypothetical protein
MPSSEKALARSKHASHRPQAVTPKDARGSGIGS